LDFKDFKPEITLNEDLSDIQKIELKKEDFKLKKVKYNYKHFINEKLSKLSNENLASLCVGKDGNERNRGIVGLTRKNINNHYLKMADGPAGLRLARVYNRDSKGYFHRLSQNYVITSSYTYYLKLKNISLSYLKIKEDFSKYPNVVYQNTTTLPIATALAQTFNTDLLGKYGNIIGKEMEIFDVQLWLAPAMNIHRNILCGRNFEYFSEDPLVSGKLAAAIIKGVQSHKNTGATIKHFAANNQENKRMLSNSKISERALREIYLKGFQIAIEKSHPYAIMTSYNLLNGLHTSENKKLLVNVLRNEWNFKGLIMTDWSTSSKLNAHISKNAPQNVFYIIKGRNNLIMPGSTNEYNILMKKLKKKLLTRNDLLICASKVYKTIELLNK
jgi:beta-glucosidase